MRKVSPDQVKDPGLLAGIITDLWWELDQVKFKEVKAAVSGSISDFLVEVAEGNVSGFSIVQKFGRNDGVPSGSWEFVNQLGFTAWPLFAATTVRIKSGGNGNDTAGGSGAVEITVQGLDDSFNEVTEAIVTAGASASAVTSKSFWRVHRAWVSGVGTYGAANTGNIIVENGGGGTDIIRITAGEGQSQFGGWTVPKGKTAYLLSLHTSVDTKKIANIRMFTRDNIDDTSAPMNSKRLRLYFDGVTGQFHYDPKSPVLKLNQKTDIWVEAYGSAATAEVSCDFELLVVDN